MGDERIRAGGKKTRGGGRVARMPPDERADPGRHQHDRGESLLVLHAAGTEGKDRVRNTQIKVLVAFESADFTMVAAVAGVGDDEAQRNDSIANSELRMSRKI